MKVSVCIPVYEANGLGVFFLQKNLSSILSQTYNNLEIVISDHSKNNEIENYIHNLQNDKIKYLRYSDNIGWPSHNTNNAIKNSTGDYVKLMNMDDYIIGDDTIEIMVSLLQKDYKWVVSGCKSYNYETNVYYNYVIPRIESDGTHLLHGINYIGCPSVGLIPKNEFFDTEVIYMIDCELWYRLFKKYGYPGTLEDYRIVIGTGSHDLTSKLKDKEKEWLEQDIDYCTKKYFI